MSKIKAAVMKALDKIGATNGHATPVTQDPSVPLVHEYNVATLGESYFIARRKKAKERLEKSLNELQIKRIDKLVDETAKNEAGDSAVIIENDPYIVTMETKMGASYLDTAALKVALMQAPYKLTALQVEALIEQCTKRRDPSKSWKVTER